MDSRTGSADVVQHFENNGVGHGHVLQPNVPQKFEKEAILFPHGLQGFQSLGVRSYLLVLAVEYLTDAAEGIRYLSGMAPERGADISGAPWAVGFTWTCTGQPPSLNRASHLDSCTRRPSRLAPVLRESPASCGDRSSSCRTVACHVFFCWKLSCSSNQTQNNSLCQQISDAVVGCRTPSSSPTMLSGLPRTGHVPKHASVAARLRSGAF